MKKINGWKLVVVRVSDSVHGFTWGLEEAGVIDVKAHLWAFGLSFLAMS